MTVVLASKLLKASNDTAICWANPLVERTRTPAVWCYRLGRYIVGASLIGSAIQIDHWRAARVGRRFIPHDL
jgi:hypothetical protein